MTVLIKRADDLKFNPLEDAVMDDIVPVIWNGPHVGTRVAEAFETLMRLPRGGARPSWGYWPAYRYEWEDMLAQLEQAEEEQARARRIQNRSRTSPDIKQVSRMERALYWPMHYLHHAPMLMRAVNAVAFAHALDRDVVWVARKRGGDPDLWQRKNWYGCELIARGLVRDKVGVF
jgi:hypothetical protein